MDAECRIAEVVSDKEVMENEVEVGWLKNQKNPNQQNQYPDHLH